jgi:NADH-quinone oxidoreductase subunit G
LGNVLNLDGFAYNTSEEVRDEVLGHGVEFASGLDNGLSDVSVSPTVTEVGGLQRIADVPINFADPMARRSPALQQTADAIAPNARMNGSTLAQLGLADLAKVRIKQGSAETVLTAKLDSGVPDGCVRVAAAHASTAMLGDMFGSIIVERA